MPFPSEPTARHFTALKLSVAPVTLQAVKKPKQHFPHTHAHVCSTATVLFSRFTLDSCRTGLLQCSFFFFFLCVAVVCRVNLCGQRCAIYLLLQEEHTWSATVSKQIVVRRAVPYLFSSFHSFFFKTHNGCFTRFVSREGNKERFRQLRETIREIGCTMPWQNLSCTLSFSFCFLLSDCFHLLIARVTTMLLSKRLCGVCFVFAELQGAFFYFFLFLLY